MTLAAPGMRSSTQSSAEQVPRRPSRLIAIFFVLLVIPLTINLGSLRLSPYRLLLLAIVLPVFLSWLADTSMKKRPCDWLIIFYVTWSGVSMVVTMGAGEAIEPFGMQAIETFGAYFLARRFVRDAGSYEFMVHWFFRIVLIILPFALIETLTSRNIALDFFRVIGPVFGDVYKEPRWGFDRVQGPFEHPILYGVFCGSAIGMVAFLNAEIRTKLWRMWLVVFTAFWSLSSGPLSGIVMQILVVFYERVTRSISSRWRIIGGITAASYVLIDLLSNRVPAEVFISYVAFSAHTAYNRIRIWELGSASVMKHPVFGLGIEPDFERPEWMSPSADMFWLLKSMQFGLPGGLALVAAFLYIVVKVCRLEIVDLRINACRNGIMISLLGIFISGWTVHFWNATYVLTCFLFGAAAWMIDVNTSQNTRPSNHEGQDTTVDGAKKSSKRRTVL